MAGTNKKTAAGGNPTAAKKNTSTKIIAVPLDVVNMSDKEIIDAAVDRLHQQDKEAKYDRYGQIMHKAGNDKPPEIEAFEKEYQKYLEELKREQERNKQKLQQSTGAA